MTDTTFSGTLQRKVLRLILGLSCLMIFNGCGEDHDKGPAEQAGAKIDKVIQETGDTMKETMDKTGTAVNEAMEGAQEKLGEIGEDIKETTQEAVQNAEKLVEDAKK
ncbi:MAG: hypothetical protein KC643_22830 [Nitrospira sp.]|nr:hypothetical protein [Nitrospira sp.]